MRSEGHEGGKGAGVGRDTPAEPRRGPLAGRRVVVTRGVERADGLIDAFERSGATVVHVPTIARGLPEDPAPLRVAVDRLGRGVYDWLLLTSRSGVRAVEEMLGGRSFRARIACVGPATAEACRRLGWRVDHVPEPHTAKELAASLPDPGGRRMLYPRADIAVADWTATLVERGGEVDDVVAYRTVAARPGDDALRELAAGVDVITFTSGSTVRNLLTIAAGAADGRPGGWGSEGQVGTEDGLEGAIRAAAVACIGPSTAEVARELGLQPAVVARRHTIAGLVAAVEDWARASRACRVSAAAPEEGER